MTFGGPIIIVSVAVFPAFIVLPLGSLFVFLPGLAFAQGSIPGKTSEQRVLMFNGFASFTLPSGDLAQEYGVYGEVGGGIQYQTKKRWLFGVEGSYFFGNGVKRDPIPNLRDPDGNVIGTDGNDAVFKVFQRAVSLPAIRFGKSFMPFKNRAQNGLGGITLVASGSWFRHWTYIQDLSKKTPQFAEEYRKGFDRLAGGPALGGWIGYLYLSEKGRLNIHLEMGYTQAFTKNKRYSFSTSQSAGSSRKDGYFQLRLRICFTVKSRSEDTVYYY